MNTISEVIQIVPRLGAHADGVADYARTLAEALRVANNINTLFVCGDPSDGGGRDSGVYRVARVEERSAAKLGLALDLQVEKRCDDVRTNLVLHYVNYGFSRRGCPFWLIDGLEQWKQRKRGVRLITVFHELYASGPPWRSSFWLSPIQRHLVGRLARLSDYAVTSSELYRRALAGWAPEKRKKICVRPVFSTIGEPAEREPWSRRQACMAVLGRAGIEGRVYERHRQAVVAAARALDVGEIVDIGLRSLPVPADLDGINIRATGHLPRKEVSRLLSRCRAGFLDYPSDVLGKSTVFAAYCAHGVVPVITHVRGPNLDGLREGEHFLLAQSQGIASSPAGSIEQIAEFAFDWYQEHAVAVQAAELAKALVC